VGKSITYRKKMTFILGMRNEHRMSRNSGSRDRNRKRQKKEELDKDT